MYIVYLFLCRTPKLVSADTLYRNDGVTFEDNWQERAIERFVSQFFPTYTYIPLLQQTTFEILCLQIWKGMVQTCFKSKNFKITQSALSDAFRRFLTPLHQSTF